MRESSRLVLLRLHDNGKTVLFPSSSPRLLAGFCLVGLLFLSGCSRPASTGEEKSELAHPVNALAPDLPGPGGLVYPNFAHAGLPADAAAPERVLDLADFGAKPVENIAPALKAALAKAAELGGAVIQFGHGTFYLDEPVLITGDNIILRGMGRGGPGYFATTSEFRYAPKPSVVEFLFHRDGGVVHPDGFVAVAAHPGLGLDYWEWNLSGEARVNPDTSGQLARIELF